MRTAYLNTTTSTFYDEDGNLWRDGFPQFIVGGNEKIKIVLCTNTENATFESANPAEWTRDTSYADIPDISAMLTADSDNIHYLKGTLTTDISAGASEITANVDGDTSSIPASGVIRLFDSAGNSKAYAYSARTASGNAVTFILSSAVDTLYSVGNMVDVTQAPYVTAYISEDTNLSLGELVFDVVFDSARLRSMTDYANIENVSIKGFEILFFTSNANGVVRKIRAFLWDSPSLTNSIGNPGFEADVPDEIMDKINGAVNSILTSAIYATLSEI